VFHKGDAVRKFREERGWTQVELARRAGVNKGTIVRLEANDPAVLLDTIALVAQALGVALEDLDPVTPPVTAGGDKRGLSTGSLTVRAQESVTVADTAKTRLAQLVGSLDEAEAAITLKQLKDWLGARWAGPPPKK
jgi:transcriptional regulator with XRE-family HTH domain